MALHDVQHKITAVTNPRSGRTEPAFPIPFLYKRLPWLPETSCAVNESPSGYVDNQSGLHQGVTTGADNGKTPKAECFLQTAVGAS